MLPANNSPASVPTAPKLVLDTNVVLDWLVFDDPRSRPIGEAIMAGRVQWLATDAMHDELADVLGRPIRAGKVIDAEAALRAWQKWACTTVPPPPASLARHLICTDPDDQIFIDLAVAIGARWLLTRDRALLALASRARAFGVAVLRPEEWHLETVARLD